MIKSVITLKRSVSLVALQKFFQVNDLYSTATRRQVTVPNAADSVGVAMPRRMLPTTIIKILNSGTTCSRNGVNLFFHDIYSIT